MASGSLTGAMTRERAAKLSDDDWRKHSPEFREPNLSKNLKLVERLKNVAARNMGVFPFRSAGEHLTRGIAEDLCYPIDGIPR
jgi:aryl-alcohol dehydrogenase-like predicted oxidoreductase